MSVAEKCHMTPSSPRSSAVAGAMGPGMCTGPKLIGGR